MQTTPIAPDAPVRRLIAQAALCSRACAELYALRSRWVPRRINGKVPMYTFGPSAYLELGFYARPLDEYLAAATFVRDNGGPAMLELLERVRIAVQDEIGSPAEYPRHVPSPGFHIFVGAAIPQTDCNRTLSECASSHFDLQHRYIPWERWYREVDRERTISFTLALKLPRSGGGLAVWESLTLDQVHAQVDLDEMKSRAHARPGSFLPYEVGSLVIHNGNVLHQIGGVDGTCALDERITLQGHGMFADGVWRLYW